MEYAVFLKFFILCVTLDKKFTNRYSMMKKALIIAAAMAVIPFSLGAQSVKDLIKEKPERAAGNLYHYEAPEKIIDTPAPKGYKPFYISNYTRHGSRYQSGTFEFTRIIPIFEELEKEGLLTETGKQLAKDIKTIYGEHDLMDGVLTLRGGQEQQDIAQRLYDRYPEVFNQPDRDRLFCVSTPVHRVLESLANFTSTVKANAPKLKLTVLAGDRFGDYLCYDKYSRPRSNTTAITDSLKRVYIHPEHFIATMFTDADKAAEIISRPPKPAAPAAGQPQAGGRPGGFQMPAMTPASFMQSVFSAGSICNCLDQNNPDIFHYFTVDELYGMAYCSSVSIYNNYAFSVENQSGRTLTAQLTINDILNKADDAVAGNNRCADLRFGHDTGIGPLLSLMGVEGYDKILSIAKDDMDYWPAFKYLNMCSNLQMIFYKNDSGDVLVKMYRNENETTIPALKTFYGPYYKWTDLRAYLAGKLEGFVNPMLK